ncbi:MAG: RnfABCDGE type electron transport complex subunit B [Clostridia bacterium]|nr:RnfABCDGE type electron transport complex subunit B [Clostridia bacterium]
MFIPILTAFLVVVAVGLVASILLSLVSRYFGVEKDHREAELRAILPGVNCGACGFKGCDDYAKALANGTAKPNLCTPGAAAVAEELAQYLGVEPEVPKDVVAFVHCNGNCEVAKLDYQYDGIHSCSAANAMYGGQFLCKFGCLGFGDCANACPNDAICIDDGIAHVDTSRCLGCGICAAACPKKIITMVPQEARTVVMCRNHDKGADARKACANACIGCHKCEKNCPVGAIKVQNNLAIIDYEICTYCGKCAEVCPTHCIKEVYFPDLGEKA